MMTNGKKSISAPNRPIILRNSTMPHLDAATAQQVHRITSQFHHDDTVDFMVNRSASYHLDELASAVEHTSVRDSTLTWDSTTIDSLVNRTHLKTGDPCKTLSDSLGKTPSVSTNHATQVTIGGHVVGSIDDGFLRFNVTNTYARYRISWLSHVDPRIDMVD
jgi:hypothetical protein